VFENSVVRRIFGPTRDEVVGEWRTLHNEEIHDLYSSSNKIERNEMGGTCSSYGGRERCV
jgi:hypothetical protein